MPFVAKVQETFETHKGEKMIQCQWYYRPDDLQPRTLRNSAKSNELFLSNLTDTNFIASILGKVRVKAQLVTGDIIRGPFFCRSIYDPKSRSLKPLVERSYMSSPRPSSVKTSSKKKKKKKKKSTTTTTTTTIKSSTTKETEIQSPVSSDEENSVPQSIIRVGSEYQVTTLPKFRKHNSKEKMYDESKNGATLMYRPSEKVLKLLSSTLDRVRELICEKSVGHIVRHLGNTWTKIDKVYYKEEEEEFTIMELGDSDEEVASVKICDVAESKLSKLRFDLSTVASNKILKSVSLSEIHGLDVSEDLVLNMLHSHVLKSSSEDDMEKEIKNLADSIMKKKWNCEDSVLFATTLRTHGQNYRRIAARSIGGRDPTDIRSIISQYQYMFKKGWTNAVRARVTAGLSQGVTGPRERPKRIWACTYCTFVNETICERCKICNEARVRGTDKEVSGTQKRKIKSSAKKRSRSSGIGETTTSSPFAKKGRKGEKDRGEGRHSSSSSSSFSSSETKDPYDAFVKRVRWHFRQNPAAFDDFASTLSSFKIGKINAVEEACHRIRVLLRNSKVLMKDFRRLVLES